MASGANENRFWKGSKKAMFAAAALAVGGVGQSQAAVITWTGATSALWNVSTNWLPSTNVPDNTTYNEIVFDSSSTANLATNNNISSLTLKSITVTNPSGNVSVTGNGFTLNNGNNGTVIDMSSASQNLSINSATIAPGAGNTAILNVLTGRTLSFTTFVVTQGQTARFTGGGTFSIGSWASGGSGGGNRTLNIDANNTVTVAGIAFNGTGRPFAKSGDGTLVVNSMTPASGGQNNPLTATAGTLVLRGGTDIYNGTAGNNLTINSGATLSIRPSVSTSNYTSSGTTSGVDNGLAINVKSGANFDMLDDLVRTQNLLQTGTGTVLTNLTVGEATGTAPVLTFNIGGANTSDIDRLNMDGAVVVNAVGGKIAFTPISTATSLAAGAYTFMTFDSLSGAGSFSLQNSTITVASVTYDLSLTTNANSLVLNVTAPTVTANASFTNTLPDGYARRDDFTDNPTDNLDNNTGSDDQRVLYGIEKDGLNTTPANALKGSVLVNPTPSASGSIYVAMWLDGTGASFDALALELDGNANYKVRSDDAGETGDVTSAEWAYVESVFGSGFDILFEFNGNPGPFFNWEFSGLTGLTGVDAVAVIPEPTSLALLGLGAMGLLARRRRR